MVNGVYKGKDRFGCKKIAKIIGYHFDYVVFVYQVDGSEYFETDSETIGDFKSFYKEYVGQQDGK